MSVSVLSLGHLLLKVIYFEEENKKMKALNTKLLRLQFNDCFEVQPEVYRLSAVGLCLSTIHSRYYSFTKEYHFSD